MRAGGWRAVGTVLVLLVAACGSEPAPSSAPPQIPVEPAIVGPADVEPLPAPSMTTSPGHHWTYLGEPVVQSVISLREGPEHCGWDDVSFLALGWPLGRIAQTDRDARQYIRDPEGRFEEKSLADFEPFVRMPPSAEFTGFRYGSDELWMSLETADTRIYLVRDGAVEQWPRTGEWIACN